MSSLKDDLLQIQSIKNTKIKPENIRSGVEIFGITGVVSGGMAPFSGETNILQNTLGGASIEEFSVIGKSIQDSTPSYNNKVDIQNITGDIVFSVTDGVETQTETFTLASGQSLCVKDYLSDDGIHKVRAKLLIDGTEGFEWKAVDKTTHYNFYTNVTSNSKKKQLILCDRSESSSFDDVLNNCYISNAGTYGNLNFNYSISGVNDSATFNTWLTTNNILIEYDMVEEEVIPYNATQQTQWNRIKLLKTYNTTTTITTTNTLKPVLTGKYYLADDVVKLTITGDNVSVSSNTLVFGGGNE